MFDRKNLMTRDGVFAALKSKGIAKVLVHYSGGNDEGGVNQIELFDANGENIGEMQEYYGGTSVWDEATNTYKPAPPPSDDQRLAEALGAPVYNKYGGFAGEYYVDGIVTWDVVNKKINDHGNEQVSHDETFDEDL
jgi:hypothetical protein